MSTDKDAAYDRILRGHPFNVEEQGFILNYCRDDVVDTALVAERILPRIGSLPQALLRAHFMRAVARIQRVGIPIDAPMYSQLIKHRDTLKLQIAGQLAGTQMNVYEGVTLKYSKLEALIHSLGLDDVWPRPARKKSKRHAENTSRSRKVKVFSTEVESFEVMAVVHPELAPLATVVKQMGDLKAFDLVVGTDSCSRYPVFPFSTNTGRCAPPSKRFLFQQSAWTRGFIAPPPGWAISYLDYSAAEVLIAAALSGDRELLDDYQRGDPYVNCAIRMHLAPPGSTKTTIGSLRDVMKIWLLSTLYGASAKSLHEKLEGSTLQQAEDFVRQNHACYARYWNWANVRTEIFLYETGVEATVFGWSHHLDPSERNNDRLFASARNRSRNFPMQATCAEILRWACVFATDDGITVHAPVHDALLVGAPEVEIEDTVTRARQHMIDASRLVLGVDLKVPIPTIIHHPDRMRDPRGAAVWDTMLQRLNALESGGFPTSTATTQRLNNCQSQLEKHLCAE